MMKMLSNFGILHKFVFEWAASLRASFKGPRPVACLVCLVCLTYLRCEWKLA